MSKTVFCNNDIIEVHYSGFTITKIYACGGELVYEATPTPSSGNIITYTAYAKLPETNEPSGMENGLHLTQFSGETGQLTVVSHTFENGVGTIIFNGDVTTLGTSFYGSTGMTSVNIPNSVTKYRTQGTFGRCTSLSAFTISNNVTELGQNTFSDCWSLTEINIPNSVTIIGRQAFDTCSGLTSVTIGSGVTQIINYAFYHCTSLQSITINAITPPVLGENVDTFSDTNNCPIYVPANSVEAYKTAWPTYASRIQPIT